MGFQKDLLVSDVDNLLVNAISFCFPIGSRRRKKVVPFNKIHFKQLNGILQGCFILDL